MGRSERREVEVLFKEERFGDARLSAKGAQCGRHPPPPHDCEHGETCMGGVGFLLRYEASLTGIYRSDKVVRAGARPLARRHSDVRLEPPPWPPARRARTRSHPAAPHSGRAACCLALLTPHHSSSRLPNAAAASDCFRDWASLPLPQSLPPVPPRAAPAALAMAAEMRSRASASARLRAMRNRSMVCSRQSAEGKPAA